MISAPVLVLLGAVVAIASLGQWLEACFEEQRRRSEEELRLQRILQRLREQRLERQLMEMIHGRRGWRG